MFIFIPQLPLASANGLKISYYARALAQNSQGAFYNLQYTLCNIQFVNYICMKIAVL
jgi:hypothetical protein